MYFSLAVHCPTPADFIQPRPYRLRRLKLSCASARASRRLSSSSSTGDMIRSSRSTLGCTFAFFVRGDVIAEVGAALLDAFRFFPLPQTGAYFVGCGVSATETCSSIGEVCRESTEPLGRSCLTTDRSFWFAVMEMAGASDSSGAARDANSVDTVLA